MLCAFMQLEIWIAFKVIKKKD